MCSRVIISANSSWHETYGVEMPANENNNNNNNNGNYDIHQNWLLLRNLEELQSTPQVGVIFLIYCLLFKNLYVPLIVLLYFFQWLPRMCCVAAHVLVLCWLLPPARALAGDGLHRAALHACWQPCILHGQCNTQGQERNSWRICYNIIICSCIWIHIMTNIIIIFVLGCELPVHILP